MMKYNIQYTVLAKTIPEYSKRDNTLYTCTIGIAQFSSGNPQLIRVYPAPISGLKKWGKYTLKVEKNKLDSRPESWKLSSMSRKDNWAGLESDVSFNGVANKYYVQKFLAERISPSISSLNDKRASIGMHQSTLYVHVST